MTAVNADSANRNDQHCARVIAFYLPQFHPVPENDTWWGPGYTEWISVAAARPLFRTHRQPNLPGRLGFYDLRLAATRNDQAELARAAGLVAFCYWHYWFGDGRELLNLPFDEVLSTGEPDFPFCLGWANDSWTGAWRGTKTRLLIEQTYPGPIDHESHFYRLLPAFCDKRYLRVHGAPVFYVRRPLAIPNVEQWAEQWRNLAVHNGLPDLHLVGETQWRDPTRRVPTSVRAWDATVDIGITSAFFQMTGLPRTGQRPSRVNYQVGHLRFPRLGQNQARSYPCVLPGWDNTPKYGRRGLVILGSTPELFQQQLRHAIDLVANREPERRLVFLKSWNEWSEGSYLEPDRVSGDRYLQATRMVLKTQRP